MKTKYFLLPVVALTFSMQLACTSEHHAERNEFQISAGIVVNSDLPANQKAEELTKQAEVLLTAQGFVQASDVVSLALKEDPTNVRAGLIQAFLGPVLLIKGIMARIRPLAEVNPEILARYETQLQSLVSEKPDSTLKSFFLEGSPDIRTEAQLQSYLNSISEALDTLRSYIKNIKEPELTIKANTFLIPDINLRFAMACKVKEDENYTYTLDCPPSESRYDITLNVADYGQIQESLAVMEMYFALLTAYDSTGVLDYIKAEKKLANIKLQDALDSISKNPAFGLLNSGNKLSQIKNLGLDVANIRRWQIGNQSDLCPQGIFHGSNRPGKLFNQGMCFSTYFFPYVELLTSVFKGEAQQLTSERNGQVHTTSMQPIAFFESPVSDLRTLGMQFDSCNQLRSMKDMTAGGLFPKGDANIVIPLRVQGCAP